MTRHVRWIVLVAVIASPGHAAAQDAGWAPDFHRDCVATQQLFQVPPDAFGPRWSALHPLALAARHSEDMRPGGWDRTLRDAGQDALTRVQADRARLPAGTLPAFRSQVELMADETAALEGATTAAEIVAATRGITFGRFLPVREDRTDPIGGTENVGVRLFGAPDAVILPKETDADAARTLCWAVLGLNRLLATQLGDSPRAAVDSFFVETQRLWTNYHENRWNAYPWEWAIDGRIQRPRRDLRPPEYGLILLHPRIATHLAWDGIGDRKFTDAAWDALGRQTALLVHVIGVTKYNAPRTWYNGVALSGLFGDGLTAGGVSLETSLAAVTIAYGDHEDGSGIILSSSVHALDLATRAWSAVFGARSRAALAWTEDRRQRFEETVTAVRAELGDGRE